MPASVRKRWKTIPVKARVIDDNSRTILWTGTTGSIDRDGEVIDPRGMDLKNFMSNPVVQFGHNYSARPVARADKIRAHDKGIDFQLRFPTLEEAGDDWYPYTDSIYRLAAHGFLNASSVGFKINSWPDKNPKGDGKNVAYRVFDDTELLELSIVPIPANPEALNSGLEKGWLGTSDDRDFMREWVAQASMETGYLPGAEKMDEWLDTLQPLEEEMDVKQLDEILAKLDALEQHLANLADKTTLSEPDGTTGDEAKAVPSEDTSCPDGSEATEENDDEWVKLMIDEIQAPVGD